MHPTAYDVFVDALTRDGRQSTQDRGHSVIFQCPAHDDRTPSLSLTRGEDRALVHCLAGCDTRDVVAAVGLTIADLYDREVDYRYGDVNVHRGADKSFRQSGNTKSTRLYREDELDKHPDRPVLIVEGEKDANTVFYHFPDAVGVSFRQGASTDPARTDIRKLKGRDVTVVADHDGPGHAFAEKVRDHVKTVAKKVRVVHAAEGKDLTDHFHLGHGLDDLVEVSEPAPARSLVVTFGDQVEIKPIEWMMDDWIPWGFLSLLAGREGLGKSTIACKIAAERTMLGEHVIYLATEDSVEHVVAPRLKAAGADMSKVMFLSVQTEFSDNGTVEFPADLGSVEDWVEEYDVTLVVLDAATSVVSQSVAGDGNNDRRIRAVLEPMAHLAARQNIAMLGLCHFGKKESSDTGKLMMGSIAWSQVARSVLAVAADEDSGHLVVTNTKANLAKRKRSESVEIVTSDLGDGVEIGVAEWRGETDTTATDLLASADEREERSEVENWIFDYLSENPDSPSADVKRDCNKETGASKSAVDRAARKLGIRKESRGMPRRTFWSLPSDVTPPSVGATDATDATGDDLQECVGATASQLHQPDATASQLRHDVSPGHAQLRQSRQLHHACTSCGEALVYADDIADGFHTADRHCLEAARNVTSIPGDVSDNTVGMTDRVAAIVAKNEGIAS